MQSLFIFQTLDERGSCVDFKVTRLVWTPSNKHTLYCCLFKASGQNAKWYFYGENVWLFPSSKRPLPPEQRSHSPPSVINSSHQQTLHNAAPSSLLNHISFFNLVLFLLSNSLVGSLQREKLINSLTVLVFSRTDEACFTLDSQRAAVSIKMFLFFCNAPSSVQPARHKSVSQTNKMTGF